MNTSFSLIRGNAEFRLFFFTANVAEIKCSQIILSHLRDENRDKQLSNVPLKLFTK